MEAASTTLITRLGDDPRMYAKVMTLYAAGIEEGAWTETRRTPNGDESCIGIAEANDLVAFATFYQPDHRPFLWLDLLYVRPDRRRHGFGAVLLASVRRHAETEKLDRIDLGTFIENSAARRLYQATGFIERGVFCELHLPKLEVN